MCMSAKLARKNRGNSNAIPKRVEVGVTNLSFAFEARHLFDDQTGACCTNMHQRLDLEASAVQSKNVTVLRPHRVVAVGDVREAGAEQAIDPTTQHRSCPSVESE